MTITESVLNSQVVNKVDEEALIKKLKQLGLILEPDSGHLLYSKDFKPLPLCFELVFIRHGETYGNCGQTTAECTIDHELVRLNIKDGNKRIFQGNVDAEINQLTSLGKEQSLQVAFKLEHMLSQGWVPDIIFYSPLSRAKETGLPFVKRNNFADRFIVLNEIREMSFGCWDNRRIFDLEPDNLCHQFYLNQHALIKNSGINGSGIYQNAENFCEVLLRAHRILQELDGIYGQRKIIMFSHSMFGAACAILLGHGQMAENGSYLAFDGKRKDNSYYIMPNATPFFLNRRAV